MPSTPATSDVFAAVAEPRRRQIIDLLASHRGMDVGAIATTMRLRQPSVSKHLGVLREVGIVSAVKQGQRRVYQLDFDKLRPIYDWAKTFEKHWQHQLDRIRARAEQRALAAAHLPKPTRSRKGAP
jgi:DNA-binding transcriptional ArsR family regulator